MSDRAIFPVDDARVSALSLTCGACIREIHLSDDALAEDFVSGEWRINASALYGDCPHCGESYDATAVSFRAGLQEDDDI
ncbi:MAG: hypothetical protein CML67_01950 [Rhodobacteraceae bacterium]|nr:hypothetical protein [Paracoccaceae bacterium]